MDLLPLTLALPILAYVAASDLRRMRIPNRASWAMLLLYAFSLPLIGLPAAGAQLLAAVTVFALGLALFMLRILAGGDVKFLAALMLVIPAGTWTVFAFVFSVAMLVAILGVTGLRQVPVMRGIGWVSMRSRGTLPMGVAMALAGAGHLALLARLA